MTALATAGTRGAPARRYEPPAIEIVVPVYNEVATLATSVRRLSAYLATAFPFSFRITVADNGPTARRACNSPPASR